MANNIIKRIWNQNKMVQIEDLKGMAFQAEDGGHTFEIYGIDEAGETVTLTGTPSGVFLRPDNTDVVLDCSVSDGIVSATLPDECYDVPGRGGLTVFITADGKKTALYAAVVTVSRTSSGNVAPPATQTVVDLVNAISAAVATIPASYTDLMADIAPTYSTSALYAVGQYAWYDGDLKRCIVPITTAESYTAAHWTSAVLGNDVSDLKSAMNAYAYGTEYKNAYVQGKRVPATPDEVVLIYKQVTSEFIFELHRGDKIITEGTFTGLRYGIGGKTKTSTYNSGWLTEAKETYIDEEGTYFVNVSKSNDANITTDEVTFTVQLVRDSSSGNKAINEIDMLSAMTENVIPEYNILDVTTSNVKFTVDGFKINVSGTANAEFARVITDTFTLPAGTYHFGNFTPITSLDMQLRRMNGTTDVENIIQTTTNGSFTLEESTTVRIRIHGTNGKTYNGTVSLMLVKDFWPNIYIPRISAVDYPTRNALNDLMGVEYVWRDSSGATALSELDKSGFYILGSSQPFSDSPLGANVNAVSHLLCYGTPGDSYRVQLFFKDSNPQSIYIRRKYGSPASWGIWDKVYNKAELESLLNKKDKTISESFSPASNATQGDNKGVQIKALSYNVANYNNDTSTYISDSKVFNLKKCIFGALPDFMMIQEDREHIDSAEMKNSLDYLYRPVFNHKYGAGGMTIYSKETEITSGIGYYSIGGGVRYATFKINDDITLLIVSTHPVANYQSTGSTSAESKAARAIQYDEIFKWVNGEINLYTGSGGTGTQTVGRPPCTHCIIGMDANTITEDDKTTLKTKAEAKNYHLGNGGFLGWIYTNFRDNLSLDNIIVSNNIIINNIESYSDWYDRLYSDHVPVVADVTLV